MEPEPDSQKLGQSLLPRHISMIAIGGIIGAGLFVGSSTAIATAGPAIILSYAFAGLIILLIMRMMGEMAVATHLSSFTEFIRLGLGNWAGYLSGWLYWYFWIVVVAIEAIAGAAILQLWMPFEVWQIGTVLLALMTGVNLMSTRSYGEFEFWFASLKVAAIIAFILIGLAYVFGITTPDPPGFANLTAHGGFAPAGIVAMFAGVTSVIFALCGAEIATIAAAESPEPVRVVSRLTGSVATRILLFYVISITLIVAIVPWPEIVPGQSPFAAALTYMGVPGAATIMNLVVLIAVLSCLNSGLYVTSRVLFLLSAKGDAPRWLVALDRRRVPTRSILIGTLFGYVALAASALSPELVFSMLVNASGATMLIIYLLVCFGQLKLRNRLEREDPERLALRMWFHPFATIFVIVAILAVLAAMAFTPSLLSQFLASVILAGAVMLSYAFRARRRREQTDGSAMGVAGYSAE
jgi:GABA permease